MHQTTPVRVSLGLLTLIGLLGSMAPAAALTFTVNRVNDTRDKNPGDGICDANLNLAGEQCSLRAAIMEANARFGPDRINVPAGTITFARAGTGEDAARTGDLDITGNLTIVGAGSGLLTLDAAGLDRVFDIDPLGRATKVPVLLQGMTITGGVVVAGHGGGIRNGGRLELNDVVVESCETRLDPALPAVAGQGGGVYSTSGDLTLRQSVVQFCSAAYGNGGGIYASGGTILIEDSTLYSNTAASGGSGILRGQGGGAYLGNLSTASTIVRRSIVSFNTASGSGGGLMILGGLIADTTLVSNISDGQTADVGVVGGGGGVASGNSPYGLLTIERSVIEQNQVTASAASANPRGGGGLLLANTGTVRASAILGNTVVGDGAGAFVGGQDSSFQDSTLAQNRAAGAGGGLFLGIYKASTGSTGNGPVFVAGTTIARNSSGQSGTFAPDEGGGVYVDNGGLRLEHSVVANNLRGLSLADDVTCPNPLSTFEVTKAALVREPPTSVATGDSSALLTGLDPLLGPLGTGAGAGARTYPLLPGSPAIDAGDPITCFGPAGAMVTDQRGMPRPVDGSGDGVPVCDLGSVEVGTHGVLAFVEPVVAVLESAGSVTLRVRRAGGSTGAVTVDWATADSTALAGVDYTASSGTLSWAGGDTTVQSITVPILSTSGPGYSKVVDVALSNATGGARLGAITPDLSPNLFTPVGSWSVARVLINDLATLDPVFVGLPQRRYTFLEGDPSASITLIRTENPQGAVEATVRVLGYTALEGEDFLAPTTTVTWLDGEVGAKTLALSLPQDLSVEGLETFYVDVEILSGNAAVGGPWTYRSARIDLVDDDDLGAGVFGFGAAAYDARESDGTVTYTLYRRGGSRGTVTARIWLEHIGTDSTDLVFSERNVVWRDGKVAPFPLTIDYLDDGVTEPDETFRLRIDLKTGGAAVDLVTGAPLLTLHDTTSSVTTPSVTLLTTEFRNWENNLGVDVWVHRFGTGAVAVDYTTASGTATEGVDYTGKSGTLSWAAGDLTDQKISISFVNEAVYEGNETFTLSLSNPTAGVLGLGTATIVILNDDAPPAGTIRFARIADSISEAGGSVLLEFQRVGSAFGAVGIDFATTLGGGTATPDVDFASVLRTFNWSDAEFVTRRVFVPIIDDNIYEGDETFTALLRNATGGASIGASNVETVTIVDDELAVPGTLELGAASFAEGTPAGLVTVSRVGGSVGAISVDYATSDGTALSGSDYGAVTGTLFWADGDGADQTVPISVVDDTLYEGDETFTFTLSNPTGGASLGSTTPATVIITDNDPPPAGVMVLGVAAISVGEAGAQVSLTVSRTGGSAGLVTVDYFTNDASAIAGADYTPSSGTLSWADQETLDKVISIPILDDTIYEGDETFTVSILSPTGGATLGAPSVTQVTIVDDELPPAGEVSVVSATYSVIESGRSILVTLRRSAGSNGAIAVDYATVDGTALAGVDFQMKSGSALWADGDTADKILAFGILDDTVYEGNETFTIPLTNPTGGATLGVPAATVITIVDDEVPPPGRLQFALPASSVNEAGASIILSVDRAGGSAGAVSVFWSTTDGVALAGADYTAASGTLSWADGDASSRSLTLFILDDTIYEGDESFSVGLSSPTGGASVGTPVAMLITIVDDEPAPVGDVSVVSATSSVSEGGVSVQVTLQRSGGSAGAISVDYATVDGTALAGADYQTKSGTALWADGDVADKVLAFGILDDTTYEGDETFTVALSNPTGGAALGVPAATVITIVDDDPAPAGQLAFTSAAFAAGEAGGSIVVGVARSGSSTGAVTVDFATLDGTATAGADYSAATGTLSWADGDSVSQSITLTLLDDTIYEGDETFIVVLSNPTGGSALGGVITTTVTLIDDDPSPAGLLAFQGATATVAEGAGTIDLLVSRTVGDLGEVTVDYATTDGTATDGADYSGTVTGVLLWVDGDVSDKVISIPILDDTLQEGDEDFLVILGDTTGGATLGAATVLWVTITDDDLPISFLELEQATYDVLETDPVATLTLLRTGSMAGEVSIDWATADDTATADEDYVPASGTVTWGDGDGAPQTLDVVLVDDAIFEGSEAFTVTLQNPVGATAQLGLQSVASVVIADDDPEPPLLLPGVLAFASDVAEAREEDGKVTLSVRRLDGSDGAVVVDYEVLDGEALAGEDFEASSGTLTWADGESADQPLEIVLLDDALPEGDETFTVQLSAPGGGATLGAPAVATVTLLADGDVVPPDETGNPKGCCKGASAPGEAPVALGLLLLLALGLGRRRSGDRGTL